MNRRQVSLERCISLPALPAPSVELRGVTVEVNGNPYWCNGTSWEDLSASQIVHQLVSGTIGRFSGTSQIPVSTTPTSTLGTQVFTQPITIKLGTKVLLQASLFGDYSVNTRYITVAFFRDSTLIGAVPFSINTSGVINSATFSDHDSGVVAGNTYTYSCRVGGSGTGTWYINQDKNTNRYGGAFSNTFTLTETD